MAITPVKFGISFTTSFLNQAGALVNIYKDGTVLVNHGGTEMGQGLNTKILKITSKELGIKLVKIKVNATNTSKIPNTSATAASSGSDLNGMAVKNAIETIKSRLSEFVVDEFRKKYEGICSKKHNIKFENNFVYDIKIPEKFLLMSLFRMHILIK
jgi:xanthine dehydrogenase molybdopterin-binding subunit B